MLIEAVGIGLFVSILYYALVGLTPGGLVVPGYIALHLPQPPEGFVHPPGGVGYLPDRQAYPAPCGDPLRPAALFGHGHGGLYREVVVGSAAAPWPLSGGSARRGAAGDRLHHWG